MAATMIAAHLASIKVFATGGIGGVHRGGESSLDVSADLTELGRTPVAVVCAGVKSVLDIPRTLEYLETQVCACVGACGCLGVCACALAGPMVRCVGGWAEACQQRGRHHSTELHLLIYLLPTHPP